MLRNGETTLASLKGKIKEIVKEYLQDSMVEATATAVRALASPHFLHELVLRLGVLSVEAGDRAVTSASELLAALADEGVLTQSVAALGLCRLLERASDLALDVREAPARVAEIILQVSCCFIVTKPRCTRLTYCPPPTPGCCR